MEKNKKLNTESISRLVRIIVGVMFILCLTNVPDATSGPVPGVTDDTILVGMHTPLTGPIALYSKEADLHEAIMLEWGKNIHGRKIKVIKLDDACDPVKGVAAVKKLIYEDKVFLINGGQCSNVCLAIRPIVEKTGTPYITQGAVADAIVVPTVKNIFNPGLVSSSGARTLVDFAMTIPNVKKVGVIRHQDEWALALYDPLVKYLKDKYNRTINIEVITERDSADVTPQVLKLKEAKVDVVFGLIYVVATTTFLRDAYKLGLNVPIMGSTATSVTDQYESLKTVGPLKNYFGPFWCKYSMDHPKIKVYEDLFKKYQPTKKFDAITIMIPGSAPVIVEALKKCGRDLTQEKFIDVLESQFSNWDPDYYVGAAPITFSKTDHIGMKTVVMSTIATGKFEVVKTYQDYEGLMKK